MIMITTYDLRLTNYDLRFIITINYTHAYMQVYRVYNYGYH